MNSNSLGYIYGWGLTLFSLTVLPPLAIAIANGESASIASFLVTGLSGSFIGGAMIIALHGQHITISRREKIFLIIALWITFCILASIPFEASNALPSRLNAIFESTSALTTTGATLVKQVTTLPKSIIYWRAQLQWVGGLLTLFTATYALVRFLGAERVTKEIYKSSNVINDERLHFSTTLRLILPVYSGLSILLLFSLLISQIPFFDALCITLSTVSTGGFLPRDGTMLSYGSIPALYVMSIFMFLGSVSVLWVSYFIKHEWSNLKKFTEPLWIAGSIILLATSLIIVTLNFNHGREFTTISMEIGTSLFEASSLISTTGIPANSHSFEFISPAILLIILMVGGGVLSTAGGLKFTRVILMLRQSIRELRSLIYPHEVRPLYLSDEEKDTIFLSTVLIIFGLSILAINIFTVLLSYNGMSFEGAYFAATAALSNCGPCFQQIQKIHLTNELPIIEMAKSAKITFISAMILGRLEILVALSALNISFWRH